MRSNFENATPPESPSKSESPGAALTAAQISALTLQAERNDGRDSNHRGRTSPIAAATAPQKRSASSELPRAADGQAPSARVRQHAQPSGQKKPRQPRSNQQRGNKPGSKSSPNGPRVSQSPILHSAVNTSQLSGSAPATGSKRSHPIPRDSGYDSWPSRANTIQQVPAKLGSTTGLPSKRVPTLPKVDENAKSSLGKVSPTVAHNKHDPTRMIREPESSPISKDQLAAEVKGIYAGLVMVEAKCINIDDAQAKDTTTELGPEQWQALIALHRTLLYEHHDFLMATQHPSATPALQALAMKYSMPARMWKHGIHAFLEVLRHRRPQSQDYMLAFIYLAYQMMALLYETVPSFTDTWIECLGDIARYRMAIEEEREPHIIWGGVAARWYSPASDRHPTIGRLYHHLGILERPGINKFCLYSRSLTCTIPFPNARDSLATLCGQISQEQESAGRGGGHMLQVRILTFYALAFSAADNQSCENALANSISHLRNQTAAKLSDVGVELVIINAAVALQFGSETNPLWSSFGQDITSMAQSSRPSASAITATDNVLSPQAHSSPVPLIESKFPLYTYDLFTRFLEITLQQDHDPQSLHYMLPSVHLVLVWIFSITSLKSKLNGDEDVHTYSSLLDPLRFNAGGLAEFLNALGRFETLKKHAIYFGRRGDFFTARKKEDAKPLSEDYQIRGLIWTQSYFWSDWFNNHSEDDGRSIETPNMRKNRAERVQRLGIYLASSTDYITFNEATNLFSAPTPPATAEMHATDLTAGSTIREPSTETQPSTLSTHSDSDGYTVVATSKPKSKPTRAYGNGVARVVKSRMENANVAVVGDDYVWNE